MIHRKTLCWNPPRARPIRGVITNVSAPKISNPYTTYLKNTLVTLGLAPYLTSIIDRCAQLFLAFRKPPTADGQYSPKAVKTRPKYLKYVTVYSSLP